MARFMTDSFVHRHRVIEQTVLSSGGAAECTFADLAGMHAAKQVVSEALVLPAKYPHLFKGQHWMSMSN